jgi:hypothetical protein
MDAINHEDVYSDSPLCNYSKNIFVTDSMKELVGSCRVELVQNDVTILCPSDPNEHIAIN